MLRGLRLSGLIFWLTLLSASGGAQAYQFPFTTSQPAAVISVAELPPEGRETLRTIKQGGPFPYERDGMVFGNREHKLPELPRGCTSDTLLTKSADCGRRCGAGAPASEDSVPPCRARYHEYTVKTPGARNRGARRIVCGPLLECYYTGDHYQTFQRIKESP